MFPREWRWFSVVSTVFVSPEDYQYDTLCPNWGQSCSVRCLQQLLNYNRSFQLFQGEGHVTRIWGFSHCPAESCHSRKSLSWWCLQVSSNGHGGHKSIWIVVVFSVNVTNTSVDVPYVYRKRLLIRILANYAQCFGQTVVMESGIWHWVPSRLIM